MIEKKSTKFLPSGRHQVSEEPPLMNVVRGHLKSPIPLSEQHTGLQDRGMGTSSPVQVTFTTQV